MHDPQSPVLSSDCFLDALTSGQLGPMVQSSFMLPQDALSAPDVEVQCRTAPWLLLILDYDGTLVPSAAPPAETRPAPALLVLLAQLAQAPGVEVAVVSGRSLTELRALLPVPGLVYLGTYGMERRSANGKTQHRIPTGAFTAATAIGRLHRDVTNMLTGRPGFFLEDKGYTFALHYHLAHPEEAERAVAKFLAAVQAYQYQGITLDVLHGPKVVEVCPLGVSKGKALQSLLTRRNTAALPVYLGDDATDEGAFRTVNGRGLTIAVADPPGRTAARYYLQNPDQVACFLARVLSLRHDGPEQNLTPPDAGLSLSR
jgi:trehalose 6-phosphate phosphatase